MTNLVDSIKKAMADPFDTDKYKAALTESQKMSPSSKYFGVKLYPGLVKSEKERAEDTETTDKKIAKKKDARERLEARNKATMPSRAEEALAARRRAASYRARSGGRASTILSDETLG